jgi:hypothetical protein
MKRENFSVIFLTVAIIIFIGRNQDIYSSIILILASVFLLLDVIPKLWKEIKKNAKR